MLLGSSEKTRIRNTETYSARNSAIAHTNHSIHPHRRAQEAQHKFSPLLLENQLFHSIAHCEERISKHVVNGRAQSRHYLLVHRSPAQGPLRAPPPRDSLPKTRARLQKPSSHIILMFKSMKYAYKLPASTPPSAQGPTWAPHVHPHLPPKTNFDLHKLIFSLYTHFTCIFISLPHRDP